MRTEKAKEYELKTNKENILSATYNLAKKIGLDFKKT